VRNQAEHMLIFACEIISAVFISALLKRLCLAHARSVS
jgi:hypothetical protein